MAKEEAILETMQPFDEELLKAEVAKESQRTAAEKIVEPKAPEPASSAEKPKAVKKTAAGFKVIRYMGPNPSYTIDRHRFQKGDALAVEKELAEYALTQSGFIEA